MALTREEIIELGLKSSRAQEAFSAICAENLETDPVKRDAQKIRFERLRAEMHAAMNAHHRALGLM